MIIIFDTETTGLPKKGHKWRENWKDFPHIVQLSWKVLGSEYVKDYIIKPNGYEIPESASKVHGITTERALKEGVRIDGVMNEFLYDAYQADFLIGHNINFDTSIVKANYIRIISKFEDRRKSKIMFDNMLETLDKDKRIDTMMKSIKFCNIPSNYGGLKWPRLEELYFKLFNETFNAHNSKDDVLATERCYLELQKRGII